MKQTKSFAGMNTTNRIKTGGGDPDELIAPSNGYSWLYDNILKSEYENGKKDQEDVQNKEF